MKLGITATQINVFDSRYYLIAKEHLKEVPENLQYLLTEEGLYLPSSTHVLDIAYNKGKMMDEWLKAVGNNAKTVAGIAAEKGTRGHLACEKLLNGEELTFDMVVEGDHYYLPPYYSIDEWSNIIKFKEFFEATGLTDMVAESIVYNLELGYAGTADLICTIDGERWLIDFKFGNSVYESHFLQIESYARCLEGIDRVGVLHMNAKTRGERKGKIQGRGWQLVEPSVDRDELFNVWKSLLHIYKFKNGSETPKSISYPKKLKLWD